MYRISVFALVLTGLFCLASTETHAQVEYGTSAAAGVDIAAVPDGPYSEENLGGTPASARADLVDAVADSRVGMNNVSCLTQITDVADSNAYTYNTFFWDTFTATSASLPSGTPTTVAFSVELGAELSASSNDPAVVETDVVSIMVVDIYSVNLTSGLPEDDQDLFVGSAVLDAATGLRLEDGLAGSDFQVSAGAAGYAASLSGFAIPIAIDTTVGSSFSLKLSVETLSSVAPGLSDGSAAADLRNSLRIVEIQTEDGVDLARAGGVTEPAPVAALSADVTSGGRPLEVEFTDESTGTITSWLWDFGNGYTSTEQNPSHTYYYAGDYTVTLTVTGPAGSDIETVLIHVDQTPSGVDSYRTIIDDIKVTYDRGGCFARYNELDGTLRIEVWEDDGILTVTCREEASTYWGPRCDVYIYAPDTFVKMIKLIGSLETDLYVCGQVGYVKKFILKHGFVGDTSFYGPEVGLGSAVQDPPKKILLKWGSATAPVLGVEYTGLRSDPAGAELSRGQVETPVIQLKSKPFDLPPDEGDPNTDEQYDDPEERAFAAAAVLAETKAEYAADIGDVKVRYTEPGCLAYVDPSNGMLTIEISDSDGILTVKCGEEAYVEWDDFCDIYIDAPDASIETMILKGTPETQLHVCGEVGHVENFKLKYGCVGDTEHYGPEFGLYNAWLGLPNKILILWGWATAPVLGVSE
jgi:PKD repeat protein